MNPRVTVCIPLISSSPFHTYLWIDRFLCQSLVFMSQCSTCRLPAALHSLEKNQTILAAEGVSCTESLIHPQMLLNFCFFLYYIPVQPSSLLMNASASLGNCSISVVTPCHLKEECLIQKSIFSQKKDCGF